MNVVVSLFCIPEIALGIVNDVSCVATIKHECCSYIVCCVPELAPRNVNPDLPMDPCFIEVFYSKNIEVFS